MSSERVVQPAAPPHNLKKLAPKVASTTEQAVEDSSRSTADHQEQEQDQTVATQFAFINTTSDVQYSGRGARSAARSHVMRNFHRKKGKSRQQSRNIEYPRVLQSIRAASSSQEQLSSNDSSSGFGDEGSGGSHKLDDKAMHFRRLLANDDVAEGCGALTRVPRPQELHRGEIQMPMSNLWPMPVDAYSTNLINHYIQIFTKSFVPVKQAWESAWFNSALSDSACFHGTLFLSLAHKALLTGTEGSLPAECFYHRGEAIRIINERLSDPENRVTDGTIAAIACLAAFETLGGSTTDATVHIGGLQKLVRMRGGLKQLGMDGFLEQFLYWVDLSNATATREKPHFLTFEPPSMEGNYPDAESEWRYFDSQWSEKLLEPLPEKSYQGLDIVENRLFHLLRQVVHLAASNPDAITGPNQELYANSVLLLERQISVAVQERISFKKKFADVMYCPPTCLFYIPALIICYMSLRSTPIRSSIYEPLILRMKDHVDHLAPKQLFDRFPPGFWFWALMFTGAASVGRPQQGYFQQLIMQLCNLLNIRTWENAKDVLKEYAWADSICERPCKGFWDTLEVVEPGYIEQEVNMMDYIWLNQSW